MMTKLWVLGDKTSVISWSQQDHKIFENALACVDSKCPDRWERVAAMTGKTVRDVVAHYRDLEDDINHIEAGWIPIPGYSSSSSFMLDWVDATTGTGLDHDANQSSCCIGGKRSAGRLLDQERKKGVPWTEEEHKLFLMGLNKYGKGDWRNISRNFVVTRTPTQVASHAQKYFIRLNSGGKDKRRASIHDITTINLPDNDNGGPCLPSTPSSALTTTQSASAVTACGRSDQFSAVIDSDRPHEVASAFSPPTQGNQFLITSYDMDPDGIEIGGGQEFISRHSP